MSDALTHPPAPGLVDSRRRPLAAAALALATLIVIALLPQALRDSYWRGVLIAGALNVIQALGLDFILGHAGQLNLGASAFYGIGAYVSTLLVMQAGVGFWPALGLRHAGRGVVRHGAGRADGAAARPLSRHCLTRLWCHHLRCCSTGSV